MIWFLVFNTTFSNISAISKDSVADITRAEVLLHELLDEEGIYDNKDILFHLLKM
jgi:hypothetical protein